MLYQAGQARAGYVDRRAGPLRFGTILATGTSGLGTAGVLVSGLSIFAIAIHGEKLLRVLGNEKELALRNRSAQVHLIPIDNHI
jgi:hypothetical protein